MYITHIFLSFSHHVYFEFCPLLSYGLFIWELEIARLENSHVQSSTEFATENPHV